MKTTNELVTTSVDTKMFFWFMSLKVYKKFSLSMVCFGSQWSHTIQCFRYLFLLSQIPGRSLM